MEFGSAIEKCLMGFEGRQNTAFNMKGNIFYNEYGMSFLPGQFPSDI